MSVIAKAIADRQSEIERLQAEIKALNDVDKILGTSAPAKPAARRSSSRRTAAAATPVAETASDATPTRKRRPMTVKEKEAVSERMKASWARAERKPRSSPPPAGGGSPISPRVRAGGVPSDRRIWKSTDRGLSDPRGSPPTGYFGS